MPSVRACLSRDLSGSKRLMLASTRAGFGEGLVEAGRKHSAIVVLCCDVTESTHCADFKHAFPKRFVQLGVSEQSAVSIAAGMALGGKKPFVCAYAAFSPGRNWEQIRTGACLQNQPVVIVGSHTGVGVGPDGATHQMTEDIALMRVLPKMTVVVPCDKIEAKKATLALARLSGPSYLRLARESSPIFTTPKTPFRLGKAEVYCQGEDVTIVAAGPIIYEAILAAQLLEKNGIQARVINCHTIKPLDETTLFTAARQTGAFVTCEDGQIAGGLGGAVAEFLASSCPVPLERIGLPDRFGESGEARELQESYGLTAPFIALAAKRAIDRKNGKLVPPVPEYLAQARKKETEWKRLLIKQALKKPYA
jgi:transketolase